MEREASIISASLASFLKLKTAKTYKNFIIDPLNVTLFKALNWKVTRHRVWEENSGFGVSTILLLLNHRTRHINRLFSPEIQYLR